MRVVAERVSLLRLIEEIIPRLFLFRAEDPIDESGGDVTREQVNTHITKALRRSCSSEAMRGWGKVVEWWMDRTPFASSAILLRLNPQLWTEIKAEHRAAAAAHDPGNPEYPDLEVDIPWFVGCVGCRVYVEEAVFNETVNSCKLDDLLLSDQQKAAAGFVGDKNQLSIKAPMDGRV